MSDYSKLVEFLTTRLPPGIDYEISEANDCNPKTISIEGPDNSYYCAWFSFDEEGKWIDFESNC